MLDTLTVDDFSARLGEVFRVATETHAESLTLVEATASRSEPPAGMRRAFSLVFLGESRATWLRQGVWPLENPALPGLSLFLACLGPNEDGRFQYEAAFT